jgi:hypothetical protein
MKIKYLFIALISLHLAACQATKSDVFNIFKGTSSSSSNGETSQELNKRTSASNIQKVDSYDRQISKAKTDITNFVEAEAARIVVILGQQKATPVSGVKTVRTLFKVPSNIKTCFSVFKKTGDRYERQLRGDFKRNVNGTFFYKSGHEDGRFSDGILLYYSLSNSESTSFKFICLNDKLRVVEVEKHVAVIKKPFVKY